MVRMGPYRVGRLSQAGVQSAQGDLHTAGLIISLSRFEKPDTTPFNDPEIAWRMDEPSHIGFILKTKDRERLLSRMDGYAERIRQDYHGSAPVPDKPSH